MWFVHLHFQSAVSIETVCQGYWYLFELFYRVSWLRGGNSPELQMFLLSFHFDILYFNYSQYQRSWVAATGWHYRLKDDREWRSVKTSSIFHQNWGKQWWTRLNSPKISNFTHLVIKLLNYRLEKWLLAIIGFHALVCFWQSHVSHSHSNAKQIFTWGVMAEPPGCTFFRGPYSGANSLLGESIFQMLTDGMPVCSKIGWSAGSGGGNRISELNHTSWGPSVGPWYWSHPWGLRWTRQRCPGLLRTLQTWRLC